MTVYQQYSLIIVAELSSNPDSKVHGAKMGPPGADRTQVGPMLAPWTLLSGKASSNKQQQCTLKHHGGCCIICIFGEGKSEDILLSYIFVSNTAMNLNRQCISDRHLDGVEMYATNVWILINILRRIGQDHNTSSDGYTTNKTNDINVHVRHWKLCYGISIAALKTAPFTITAFYWRRRKTTIGHMMIQHAREI